eukprot:scaffold2912_cov68-Phaeocystis_antarctica.AAC.4
MCGARLECATPGDSGTWGHVCCGVHEVEITLTASCLDDDTVTDTRQRVACTESLSLACGVSALLWSRHKVKRMGTQVKKPQLVPAGLSRARVSRAGVVCD